MEDLQRYYKIIFYVAMALLYFFFSGRKKKPQGTPAQEAPKSPVPPRHTPSKTTTVSQQAASRPRKLITARDKKQATVSPPGPASLEDLMKEYGNLEKESMPAENTRMSKPVSYEVQNPKVEDYDDAYIAGKGRKRSFMDEEVEKDKAFGIYAQGEAPVNPYAAMLKDPETLKAVIVAQEIFRPKYF